MKIRIIVAALACLSIVPASGQTTTNVPRQVFAQEFDTVWAQVDKIKNESKYFYNGPVSPVWIDETSFVYSTNEKDGMAWYKVDVKASSKTSIAKEEYDSAAKATAAPGWGRRERPSVIDSPDGSRKAVLRDNNVWVEDAGGLSQLSFDGTDAYPYVRVMWSPDSKKIAALRTETEKERQILLRESRPSDQVQPKYRWLDYAKPGDVLPQSETALFDAESHYRIMYSNAPYANQYRLSLGRWSPDSSYFTFEYNQRGHQVYQLVAVDANTGANRILADENTAKYPYKFIYYNMIYRHYFADGKRILWESERDGYNHFYMIDAATGSNRQLTKGEWNVRDVYDVNETDGTVLFTACGFHAGHERGDVAAGAVSVAGKGGHGEMEDPYNLHLLKLELSTGKLTDLTPENANHNIVFGKDKSFFIDNYSRPDLPNTSAVRSSRDGSVLMTIHKQDITDLLAQGFTMPEVFVAKARDGKTDIWGTIIRPDNFNPKKKYPVVEYIYAGPHENHVKKDFAVAGERNRRLAALGFIVVCIDGMGTDNRSREFHDVCWQNLKDAGFPDRILWMKAAASVYGKSFDISNVGIYGYSAGGQNTLGALLFHPEFYKVGVALCGCHDNRMDKIWWNEQWMGYPIGPWYSESSNVDNAYRLEGKLFIINGEVDDNVDPASTLQVVSELVKHNKEFQQLYLPGYSHNLGDEYVTKHVFKFLYENCR